MEKICEERVNGIRTLLALILTLAILADRPLIEQTCRPLDQKQDIVLLGEKIS
jgi:hypothetical protein